MSNEGAGAAFADGVSERASRAEHVKLSVRIEQWMSDGVGLAVIRDCHPDTGAVTFRLLPICSKATEAELLIPTAAHGALCEVFIVGGSFAAEALKHMPETWELIADLDQEFMALFEMSELGKVVGIAPGAFGRKANSI